MPRFGGELRDFGGEFTPRFRGEEFVLPFLPTGVLFGAIRTLQFPLLEAAEEELEAEEESTFDAVLFAVSPPPLPLLLLALPLVVVVVAGPPSRGSSVRRGSGTVTSSSTRSSHPRHQIVIVVVDGEALQGIIGGGGGGIGGRGREVHIYCLLRSNVVTIHRSALAHMPWPMAAMAMAHGSAADADGTAAASRHFLLVMARACRANL